MSTKEHAPADPRPDYAGEEAAPDPRGPEDSRSTSGGSGADPPRPGSHRTRTDSEESPLRVEPTFSGSWTRLDRLGTVAPRTVVVVSSPGRPAQLKLPGEVLVPAWPLAGAVRVLVVNREPVTLHVRADHLTTLDGEEMESVELDVRVRLDESRILAVVSGTDEDPDRRLVIEARRAIEASVRAAVGLNRAADLRRQSLVPVLDDQWLPTSFVGGALIREQLTVRRVRWAGEPDLPPQPPSGRVGSSLAPPRLLVGSLASRRRSARPPTAAEAMQLVYLPALISVGAFWVFFVSYWLPEVQSLPGARFVLEQLAPLASKELTSRSEPLLPSQVGHSGLGAAFLLLVSLLLPALARARHWLVRLAIWPVTYLAVVCAAVSLIGTLVRGRGATELLGLLLVVGWVVAAAQTAWRSLWVDIDLLPRRPARVLWLPLLFALLSAAPIAVGRCLFAPSLRSAALNVVHNDLTLRWAALLTPTTALVYLSGLLVGALVWAGHELWPPWPAASFRAPVTVLVVAVAGLALVAPQTGQVAARRAEVIATQSPRAEMGFTCGVWTQPGTDQVVLTLVVSGLTCKRVTAFRGYHEVVSRNLDVSTSAVRAETLDGQQIPGKVVAGQYGQVLVLVASDRLDHRANQLVALSVADGLQLWRYACPPGTNLSVRFARTTQGDESSLGRLTRPGEPAGISAGCGADTVALAPGTGRPL